jgi:hypothetical protein
MDDGWTYGPLRDDKNKVHPLLVPYIFMSEEEKRFDHDSATKLLLVLFYCGCTITEK